jgi:signal peptide peptidase SppA
MVTKKHTVLITGGTGSFGKQMTKFLLKKKEFGKIIIFSRDELKQSEMSSEMSCEKERNKLRFFIGDVRDKERLDAAFRGNKIDIVIHAAALKQVPTAEYNPFEVIKTNIIGAQNIIDICVKYKVKKVIVSMGDVAASGGYYIASPAYKIFAESTTITGSIGVFGMIPYTGKMLQNKLGITFDQVSTNKHSVLSSNRKLSPEELAITQAEVDQIYDQFLKRVADGRKMTKDEVNVIARGRVWTGRDALRIGLVDQLGGLPDAIAFATNNAKLKNPKVIYYPLKEDDSFSQLIELIEEETENDVRIKSNALPKEFMEYYEKLKKIEGMSGIQMRLPYDLTIK